MKTTTAQFGILTNRTSQTCEMTEGVSGRKPVLALLMRLLLAAALVLPLSGAQAGAVVTTLDSFQDFTNGASGPFSPEEILVHPDKDGICLRYKAGQRSSNRTVQASSYKVHVDTGIAGYGVEAYLALTDQVVVVDTATQETLWSTPVGAWYNGLAFVQAKDTATGKDKVLLWVGGKDDVARLFEIRTGTENHLRKRGDVLIASPENSQQLRGTPLQARQVIAGGNSKINEQKCVRVMAPAEWTELWATHSPSNTPPPQIDFDKEMVLGFFQGQGVNCTGIAPLHILDCQDTFEVFVRGQYFQSSGGFVPARAFGFFVVPKSAKRLLVKENIQGYIGGPPIWKQIAAFDALPR
jgi:hypothetical protein